MNEKHGVTGVIFDEKNGIRHFLVMHRVLNWRGWEFVKGGIENGENPHEAVLREISEETGLKNISVISVLPQKVSWTAKDMKYIYTPFVLKGDMNEPLDLEQEIIEHDGYKWLPEDEVEKILTHLDNKKILREALQILAKKYAQ
ncbi:MAG TPA: NUDIX hydrolase [archaeon]|nr:NUDIX hydrolase [archaeon]